jgi:hypothetical protein
LLILLVNLYLLIVGTTTEYSGKPSNSCVNQNNKGTSASSQLYNTFMLDFSDLSLSNYSEILVLSGPKFGETFDRLF